MKQTLSSTRNEFIYLHAPNIDKGNSNSFFLFPNITLLQEYRLQNYLSETKPINILCELFVSKKYSDQVFIGQLLQKLKSPFHEAFMRL